MKKTRYIALKKILAGHQVLMQVHKNKLTVVNGNKDTAFILSGEHFATENLNGEPVLHEDLLIREPKKIASIVLSKLKLNTTVFARNCEVKRIEKKTAEKFLDQYHLMNSTSSAFNFGLFLKNELIAVASFSKGRKMNRLPEAERSFELIRFCCKPGTTVTGGLTKLVKNFCEEKKAGDIMTYVDKQLTDGSSFIKAGFKKHSETGPNYFLVDRTTQARIPANKDETFDKKKFYLSHNFGNIKLIYCPPGRP